MKHLDHRNFPNGAVSSFRAKQLKQQTSGLIERLLLLKTVQPFMAGLLSFLARRADGN
jgi:hypothetical protein